MNKWEIYEVLKRDGSGVNLQDIAMLENDPAEDFKEAVIEFLMMKFRTRGN